MAGKHAVAQCVAGVCKKLSAADSPPVSGDKQELRVGFNFKLHVVISLL